MIPQICLFISFFEKERGLVREIKWASTEEFYAHTPCVIDLARFCYRQQRLGRLPINLRAPVLPICICFATFTELLLVLQKSPFSAKWILFAQEKGRFLALREDKKGCQTRNKAVRQFRVQEVAYKWKHHTSFAQQNCLSQLGSSADGQVDSDRASSQDEVDTDDKSDKPSVTSAEPQVFGPKKLYNLDEAVQVWSDFLRLHLHPKSVGLINEYQHNQYVDGNGYRVFLLLLSPQSNVKWRSQPATQEFSHLSRVALLCAMQHVGGVVYVTFVSFSLDQCNNSPPRRVNKIKLLK